MALLNLETASLGIQAAIQSVTKAVIFPFSSHSMLFLLDHLGVDSSCGGLPNESISFQIS